MDDKRNHRIYCRLTSAEYGRFKTEVRKTYLSDSEYIRRKLLHPQMRIRSREETDLLNFVIGSLSQVNNNINQIGLKELGNHFQIDGDLAENPDAYIIRSQNLHDTVFPDNLKAIAGVEYV